MIIQFYHENVSVKLDTFFFPGHNEIIYFFGTVLKVQVLSENSVELIKLSREEFFRVLRSEIEPSPILVTINKKDYEKRSQYIKKGIHSSGKEEKIQEIN
jgi:hypothetical protein